MTDVNKILGTFVVIGMLLWLFGGFIVNMACFQPIIPMEEIKQDKHLAQQIRKEWSEPLPKILCVWGLTGGFVGFITFLLFICKPSYEHTMIMPRVATEKPKTMAEVKTTLQIWIIGTIISIGLTFFVLPLLHNPVLLVVKSSTIRIVIGGIEGLIMAVPILPFAQKWIN